MSAKKTQCGICGDMITNRHLNAHFARHARIAAPRIELEEAIKHVQAGGNNHAKVLLVCTAAQKQAERLPRH